MTQYEPLRSRLADVEAVTKEHTDAEGEPIFVAVICNGCTATLTAPTVLDLGAKAAAEDWSIGENLGDPDYCGECRG